MKVPAFTMLKDVQHQHTQRLAFMQPLLKSLRLMVPTCATQLSKTGSDSVYNLVTKRATAKKNATVEWIDGNLGAEVTMKYPSVYLDGEGARGTMLSIAFANAGQHQDTGAKMIHNAPHTSSSIVSKSIARNGGKVDYRGQVTFNKDSKKSVSHIECDTILMDDLSKSDTIPFNENP